MGLDVFRLLGNPCNQCEVHTDRLGNLSDVIAGERHNKPHRTHPAAIAHKAMTQTLPITQP